MTTIISYSLTGNNAAFAKCIASALSARHIVIAEPKPRTNFRITLDLLFRRTPRIELSQELDQTDDLLIFVGPVWMGMVAFPLRACLDDLKSNPRRYAFISISGGGDGPNSNPNLAVELKKRTGLDPVAVINLHIADLVSTDQKPTPEQIQQHEISTREFKQLVDLAVSRLMEMTN